MAYSLDPDETAHDEPSHQDLHCLQKCFGLQGWKGKAPTPVIFSMAPLLRFFFV